jgi:hypothetical protein
VRVPTRAAQKQRCCMQNMSRSTQIPGHVCGSIYYEALVLRKQRCCMMPPPSCDTIRRAKCRRGGPGAASVCGRRRRSCELLRAADTGRCKARYGGSRVGNRGNTLKKRVEGGRRQRWEQAVTCIPLKYCLSFT